MPPSVPAPPEEVPLEEPLPEEPVPLEEPLPEEPVPLEEPIPLEDPTPLEEPLPLEELLPLDKPFPLEEPLPPPEEPVPPEEAPPPDDAFPPDDPLPLELPSATGPDPSAPFVSSYGGEPAHAALSRRLATTSPPVTAALATLGWKCRTATPQSARRERASFERVAQTTQVLDFVCEPPRSSVPLN
jgi:hypothetical protein